MGGYGTGMVQRKEWILDVVRGRFPWNAFQEGLVLEEIAIFKDPFDLVDFEVHDVLGRLESRGQKTHELVDIEMLVGDNVQLYSIETFPLHANAPFPGRARPSRQSIF